MTADGEPEKWDCDTCEATLGQDPTKARVCLKRSDKEIVTYKIKGIPRLFIITKETFWDVYGYLRAHYPKTIAPQMLENLSVLSHERQICPVPFIDDPETGFIINTAFNWERTKTPPWELYPDCDRGAITGLCQMVWNAMALWQREKHNDDMRKLEAKKNN